MLTKARKPVVMVHKVKEILFFLDKFGNMKLIIIYLWRKRI